MYSGIHDNFHVSSKSENFLFPIITSFVIVILQGVLNRSRVTITMEVNTVSRVQTVPVGVAVVDG